MNNIILFDDDIRDALLPLTFTRPVGELRVGILTIREKWEKWLQAKVSYITQDYLSEKYPIHIEAENYVISGSVLPSDQLCRLISQLETNEALLKDGELIAAKLKAEQFDHLINNEEIEELEGFDLGETDFMRIEKITDIFRTNGAAIQQDFDLLTKGRRSQPISVSNQVLGAKNIFIEEGASVECATLNATQGPIYIGKNAQVMEGCMLRGPIALCDNATFKMGAKIYGPVTLGPHCKGAGEISKSVLLGYSSKAHDGYLGNAVLGEWCNLGADTNCSNLKNNYSEVKIWDYQTERFQGTGLQFCGLIMGDHSKSGINTMFNTGTVVGVFANIYGAGFPRTYIPSFAWGGASGFKTYQLEKTYETAALVMQRRQKEFDEVEQKILQHVFQLTQAYRRWEKAPSQETA